MGVISSIFASQVIFQAVALFLVWMVCMLPCVRHTCVAPKKLILCGFFNLPMNALRQGLRSPEAHQFQLYPGDIYASQVVGLQVDATPAWLLCGFWGSKLQFSCLSGKYFFHQLTYPSLWLVFWYWNGPGQILDYLNGITTYAANSQKALLCFFLLLMNIYLL